MVESFFPLLFFCIVYEERVSKNSAERSISFPSLRPAESPFPPYRPSSRGWANTSATVQRGSRWIEERMEEKERKRKRRDRGGVEGVYRRFLGVEATWCIDRVALASRPTPLSDHPVYACACACVYASVYVCTSRCLCSYGPTCVVYTECFT